MELLELALKQTLVWSLSGKQADSNEHKRSPLPTGSGQKALPSALPAELFEELERARSEVERESQVRALVSRFKIELNQLMGLESLRAPCELAGERAPRAGKRRARRLVARPTIEMSGKYSGVYNIDGAQTTDDDDDDFEEVYLRHLELAHAGSPRAASEGARIAAAAPAAAAAAASGQQQQVDDGYRSLSRDSSSATAFVRTTSSLKPSGARPAELLRRRLNDIRSRLIDLVRELDRAAAPRLAQEEREAYTRRRDALLLSLEALIEEGRRASAGPSSQSSSSCDGYEEQTQVIDYDDLNQGASDLSSPEKHRSRAAAALFGERPWLAPELERGPPRGGATGTRIVAGQQALDLTSATMDLHERGKLTQPQQQQQALGAQASQSHHSSHSSHSSSSGSSDSSSGSHSSTTTSSFI